MREEAEKRGVRVSIEEEEVGGGGRVCSDLKVDDEGGSQGGHLSLEKVQICSNHEDCLQRLASIKITKGFVAKEPVKGHMVNVVKGLKLYEDIFTDTELSKLVEFINELRLSGRNGDLSGETFIFFNQQLKGNRKELIQLGIPIFGQINEEATSNIEPIPSVLQAVIDHLVQWRLIPESRKPNSCIISFFDEGEYSQPYLKPPHLDPPISTLLLSESTMAFGRALVRDPHGNFKGPLMLSLKEGSLLVMRGNSAEVARHVTCPSSNQRVNITFVKVQPPATKQIHPSVIPPLSRAMTAPQLLKMPTGPIGYEAMGVVPRRGVFHAPLVMLAPARPMVMGPTMFVGPRRIRRGGTGVFLPWTVGPKKSMKHLPPRVRRERLLLIPPSTDPQVAELSPDPEVTT
eukprot:TRINITY_DN6809_c0_g1_i1.p1 TRINITY_DN6809_c0_g1~~TRINITY_DN6809_c0_g1_i1.p1  ORF type:complete len:402 (+),score=62.20 TRINITY_DN6809_c0_g1_i1:164-1369(+)